MARALLAAACLALALGGGPARAAEDEATDVSVRDPDFKAGKAAVARKDWGEAARRFAVVAEREPDNADVHNMLGFAQRHLGRLQDAFRHYRRALELDPRHKGAHEYLGETYLLANDLAGAERHLQALRGLCPDSCEELRDLERGIAEHRRRR